MKALKKRKQVKRTNTKPITKTVNKNSATTPKTVNVFKRENADAGKSIAISTVQGIGDIFWVYQKLAPFFDWIDINVYVSAFNNIQTRSVEWLKIFPKIRTVNVQTVKQEVYYGLMRSLSPLDNVLAKAKTKEIVPYAVNAWLEEGTRIDEIDEHPILETVKLDVEPCDIGLNEYIVVNIPGAVESPNVKCWRIDEWDALIRSIYFKYKLSYPIVLVGADFDVKAINQLHDKLVDMGIMLKTVIGEKPAKVCSIIKAAKLFIGFQSGLNVIAENFDVNHISVDYVSLEKMKYTWCKKKNKERSFYAFLFNQTALEVAEAINYEI